jgi:hypothetical protein
MHKQPRADRNETGTIEEDARVGALLSYLVALRYCRGTKDQEIRRVTSRGSAMKTLVSLLVVVVCGMGPTFGATNDVHGTPGGAVIALSGRKSASQSPPGGVTTPIREYVLLQHAVKGMDTNSLNASSNGKLLATEQQPALTNSVSPVEPTALGPVDVAAVTRVNQRQEYFSDQDQYGGILYKAYRAENPLQLINPFAPREYGQSEATELSRDAITGIPSGFSVFSIRFK